MLKNCIWLFGEQLVIFGIKLKFFENSVLNKWYGDCNSQSVEENLVSGNQWLVQLRISVGNYNIIFNGEIIMGMFLCINDIV